MWLPDGPVQVHVARADFEKLITPAVHASVDVLLRALRPVVGAVDQAVEPAASPVVPAQATTSGYTRALNQNPPQAPDQNPPSPVSDPAQAPGRTALPQALDQAPGRSALPQALDQAPGRTALSQAPAQAPGRSAVISAVLMVGGSVRVPLVAELVAAQLPARLATEADPEFSVARGAALAACRMVPGRDRPLPALLERTSVLAPIVDNAGQDQSQELDQHGWIPVPVEELDHRNDELAEPPPRPPVQVTPLEVPERLLVKRLVHNLKERRSR